MAGRIAKIIEQLHHMPNTQQSCWEKVLQTVFPRLRFKVAVSDTKFAGAQYEAKGFLVVRFYQGKVFARWGLGRYGEPDNLVKIKHKVRKRYYHNRANR